MIRLKTEKGTIAVDSDVYTNIAGYAATNCFGVKGMAFRSMTDGLVHLLRKEAMGKGVRVTFHDGNAISIDLHIIIDKGLSLIHIFMTTVQISLTNATNGAEPAQKSVSQLTSTMAPTPHLSQTAA